MSIEANEQALSEGEKSQAEKDNEFDIELGRKIRLARTLRGIKQRELADILGVSFQQVQKYETGANRVSAIKLWKITNILNVPVNYFYPDSSGILEQPALNNRIITQIVKMLLSAGPEAQKNLYHFLRRVMDKTT